MHKYYKLPSKDKKLKPPLEYHLMKLTTFGLLTFLVTLAAVSAFAPVQTSSAEEILLSTQATGEAVSLTTAGTVNLSLLTGVSSSVRTAMDAVTVTSGTTGYQLYISTSGETNALVRDGTDGTSISDLIPSTLTTDINNPTILSNDTWGFAVPQPNAIANSGSEDVVVSGFDEAYPTGDNSVASSKFIAVPTKSNPLLIAKHTGTADAITTNVYYGAKATTAKPSGLYKGTVVYTAIGNSTTTGMAEVSPNRTDKVTGGAELTITTPSTVTLDDLGTISVTVGGRICTNPIATKADNGSTNNVTCTAPGLTTGWHEVIVTFENSEETYVVNPGIEYIYTSPTQIAQNNAITAIQNDTTDGTLDLSSILTMQQFSADVCQAMKTASSTSNTNKNYLLKDTRDNNTYKVAKLPDGNCWMVTNLMLGNTIINSGSITINSDNSDYSGTAFTISSSNVMASGKTNNWTSNDYDVLHIYARSASEKDGNGNSYGNLYNWYTATAKSGTYSMSSGDAPYSICPKGWQLPAISDNPSYVKLFQTPVSEGGMGITASSGTDTANFGGTSTTIAEVPYNFPITGIWYSGALRDITDTANWLRRASGNANAARFYFNVSGNFAL